MNAINEYFVNLAFKNGKDITKEQLNDTLVKNNYVYIELYDGHWSPIIYIPDEVPFSGGIIYITSKATFKSNVYVYDEQYIISRNEELVVLGSPTKQWVAVTPASSVAIS